jgi:hypothetical protein
MAPITPTSIHDDVPARPRRLLRRAVVLTAIAAAGLLAPTAAGALPGETPPAPQGPGGFSAGEPDDCDPRLGSCDIGIPEPDDCPPPSASCDLTAGDPDPEDPGDPDDPGEIEPSADPVTPTGVDAPVRATPNFTG